MLRDRGNDCQGVQAVGKGCDTLREKLRQHRAVCASTLQLCVSMRTVTQGTQQRGNSYRVKREAR